MKNVIFFISVFIFFVAASADLKAQGIGNPGQIISRSQARHLFGEPIDFMSFNKKALLNLIKRSNSVLMIGRKNGRFVISNSGREVLYPSDVTIQSDEVMNAFGLEVLTEFLNQVEGNKVLIEIRPGEVLTISSDTENTADGYTLEYSVPCPPICPW